MVPNAWRLTSKTVLATGHSGAKKKKIISVETYEHGASCIPLSHANWPNMLQDCMLVIYQTNANASIEISAETGMFNTSYMCDYCDSVVLSPGRVKVTAENTESSPCCGEMEIANP